LTLCITPYPSHNTSSLPIAAAAAAILQSKDQAEKDQKERRQLAQKKVADLTRGKKPKTGKNVEDPEDKDAQHGDYHTIYPCEPFAFVYLLWFICFSFLYLLWLIWLSLAQVNNDLGDVEDDAHVEVPKNKDEQHGA